MPPLQTSSITLDPRTIDELAKRQGRLISRSEAIRRIVERYAEMCLRSVPPLSTSEWAVVRDACGGMSLYRASDVRALPVQIADGIRMFDLARKWGVDGDALLRKIEGLDFAGMLAVADHAETWWAAELPPIGNEGYSRWVILDLETTRKLARLRPDNLRGERWEWELEDGTLIPAEGRYAPRSWSYEKIQNGSNATKGV